MDGRLTLDELGAAVAASQLDTVILAMCDMQGRLQGKRLHGRAFVDGIAEHGAEGCNYLLAVDVDMNTVEGYAMSSWERGYGDFVLTPDLATLRRIPWLPGHRALQCDLQWHDGSPVVPSPRQMLRAQLARLAERGWRAMVGSELEFILFAESYESSAAPRAVATSGSRTPTTSTTRSSARRYVEPRPARDTARHGRRGHARRGLQGRVQLRPARGQLPLRRGAAMADDHTIYRNGAKEIALPARLRAHVHAEVRRARGQLVPHPHLALGRRAQPLPGRVGARALARSSRASSPASSRHLRELTLFLAPNVNSYKRFVRGSFAPTALVWGHDNRTCALRVVGHGNGMRVECRVAGGDVNPYLAFAALIAAGLAGIDGDYELEPAWEGSGYDAHDAPARALDAARGVAICFAGSALAREAFGDEVVDALPERGDGRAGRVRPGRHRLGAAALLRAACEPPAHRHRRVPDDARWTHWDLPVALIPQGYVDGVRLAGGLPLVLPPTPEGARAPGEVLDGDRRPGA